MKHIEFKTQGVCSKTIIFDITDDGKIANLSFVGGCNGNLRAISKLVEGQDAKTISKTLRGNVCGSRDTSCTDQLAQAIEDSIK